MVEEVLSFIVQLKVLVIRVKSPTVPLRVI